MDVPVFVIYRENHIYNRYLSPVVYGLLEQGWKVRVISYPPGTEGAAIGRDLEQRSEELRAGVILADRTIFSRLPRGQHFPGLLAATLDNVFCGNGLSIVCRQLGIKQLFDVEVSDTPGVPFMTAYFEAHRARLQSVIRKAMESGVPDWIIIDERKLNEHVPFHILPEKDGPAVAARHLRQWLRELPFPADRIWVTKRLSKLAPDNFVGAERMWFFGDRHWQDTPRAQAEIAAFVRRIELCAHEQALEHALESGEFDEFDEPVDAPPSGEQPSPSVPWDGDDGIDEIDRIDPGVEPDEAWDDASLLSDDPFASFDAASIDSALRRLSVVPEMPQIKIGLIPTPMDSMLESLISSGMLAVEHFSQTAALVSAVRADIEERLPELASQVLRAKP